jgi:protein-tyrosine phosphatase
MADPRARKEGERRGYALDSVARKFDEDDYGRFDLICVMDNENLNTLQRGAPNKTYHKKLVLLREFDCTAEDGEVEIPDPYYGSAYEFGRMFDMLETSCDGLLQHLIDEHQLRQ